MHWLSLLKCEDLLVFIDSHFNVFGLVAQNKQTEYVNLGYEKL